MNLEDTRKIINDIIQNEFNHIQENQEHEYVCNNIEINIKSKNTNEALNKLIEVAPEHRELIDKFENEFADYEVALCRYYFKKGVVAGITNLKFLENTNITSYI